MLDKIISFSINNKLIVLLITACMAAFGIYAVGHIPIGAVPDVTNNQVQVITTSRNLSTQDMEQYVTYPVELEMANLPGVEEIRSISKFGLSVVTIVFSDEMGTHLPRQLIAEKLQSAAEQIPEGFGKPSMGPISTGLGEIYQYILDVKPGYEETYSITDLRTIQDWIVKRQLSGIKGVVEVNTWGGYLKQYEVAINTQRLNALNIKIREVFEALELNNSISGGGYIEKANQSFFIRGDGVVSSLDDIRNIVVKTHEGNPIYIRDIAEVGFGSAPRFGAITANGEGEKVLGQVMMLKDANSKEVINRVKARIDQISASLPEGVYINGFLDRSELIGKTMFTVTENLILACLIVIFVVVLLLGNIRSGLIVASVIPLALLFALGMMYVFDVDANLMSLGAIDFGIIIDGAVIIVEFITYQLTKKSAELQSLSGLKYQKAKDKLAFKGASKMMNSAIFGQFIILIVFIPILSLDGVEGKMFRPMALVFGFALIGAMLLCLTYIPVMTSLVVKPSKNNPNSISNRIMNFLQRIYNPLIDFALHQKKLVIGLAIFVLILTGIIFSRMGSEFVPTLDEGDFVIQPVFKTGTSLGKTIEYTTKIEKVLKKQFSEVDQVVTRIGAAEVPTDPMSMEESDVIITLKPKSEWENAESKDELADLFKEALQIIPGMEIEFTQPIEMRFNELISGVRADIAIKVFGEELSVLSKLGDQIKSLIEDVPGAADISVEKIEGLPQMAVDYNRTKIARYGLNISEVNEVLSMAFAGRSVGQVFEGEKRFDLVLRLEDEQRQQIDDIRNLYVDLPSGGKVPLKELADISIQKGAAQISRDDTRRRTVVGVNVRHRDLQSVVEDIQGQINQHLKLPPNYTITYGGQFENLQSASNRLLIVVPIALLLIFVLLYFAFQSLIESMLVFTAIPFAAIGGVLLLWFRDMPFSISAGVGFIALFGIAVLNGIVLIEHYKELDSDKFNSLDALIKQGAKDRLRAILLTAMAAALGFLPMAVSTGAGAEVQRPLATVVVGGLISSTILTLFILPLLYAFIMRMKWKLSKPVKSIAIFTLLSFSLSINAQNSGLDLDDLLNMLDNNNPQLQSQKSKIKQAEILIEGANTIEKTEIYFGRDENNLAINDQPLSVFGISQRFSLPSVYKAGRKLKEAEFETKKIDYKLYALEIKQKLASNYYEYQTSQAKLRLYEQLDSLYARLPYLAERKEQLGEGNSLDRLNASTDRDRIQLQKELLQLDIEKNFTRIKAIFPSMDSLTLQVEPPMQLKVSDRKQNIHPAMQNIQRQKALVKARAEYNSKQRLPDFSAELFNGFNAELMRPGFQLGVHVGIFQKSWKAKNQALQLESEQMKWEKLETETQLNTKRSSILLDIQGHSKRIAFYNSKVLPLGEELVRQANRSLEMGDITIFDYIKKHVEALQYRIQYLDVLNAYNQAVIQFNYLTLKS